MINRYEEINTNEKNNIFLSTSTIADVVALFYLTKRSMSILNINKKTTF